jgi:hypothetical protein
VLCPDTRSTDKHGGFQKLSSRNRSHLQRPQIKIYLFEVRELFFTLAPAWRMPQGGEKPAPPSSLTSFKSIGYQKCRGGDPRAAAPAKPGSQHAGLSRGGMKAWFWLAGTERSGARTLTNEALALLFTFLTIDP